MAFTAVSAFAFFVFIYFVPEEVGFHQRFEGIVFDDAFIDFGFSVGHKFSLLKRLNVFRRPESYLKAVWK